MNSESTRMKRQVILRVIAVAFDYLCYGPLTYAVLYSFAMVVVLIAGTSTETIFIHVPFFFLGIKGADANLNGQDIMRSFFYWWLIIGIIFQLLKKIFHIDFSKGILITLFLFNAFGTVTLIIKTNSVFVPLFLLISFVVNILIYYALNWGSTRIQLILSKMS